MKKIVLYKEVESKPQPIIGGRMLVVPINHPNSPFVSNTGPALTSLVQEITEDGFITENTRYVLQK